MIVIFFFFDFILLTIHRLVSPQISNNHRVIILAHLKILSIVYAYFR